MGRVESICEDAAPKLEDKNIDSYIVNLIDASNAPNVIDRSDAMSYLQCLADDDPHRVCQGNKKPGVTVIEFMKDILPCLLPKICEPPTGAPTTDPTYSPTPKPTRHPTKKPTKRPTKNPTRAPTPKPSKKTKPPTPRYWWTQ